MNRLLSVLIVVCVVLAPGFGQAGTVVLKNGHVINGKIIVSDDEKVIMSWGNGRTTIYHRFIESISLTEEEKLSLRQYRSAQAVTVSLDVNPAIHLPEFNELHAGDPEVLVEGAVVVVDALYRCDTLRVARCEGLVLVRFSEAIQALLDG